MELCDIKRCTELWLGDPAFREAIANGDPSIAKERNLNVDPVALRAVWDETVRESCEPHELHPAARAYMAAKRRLAEVRRELLQQTGQGNPTYRGWRTRQVNRYLTETDRGHAQRTAHLACAIELSSGCSIGCDYCSLDAKPLQGVARYTPSNEALFRSTLEALETFFGKDSVTGFLYWATDPLDNRDYETYLRVFGEKLGWHPQTTTAAWHRNLPRTRALIQKANANREATGRREGGVRMSINTLEQFYLCMKTFSAEELAQVELILNQPESLVPICAAGRGNNGDPRRPWVSNACVTGFLINLVDRSVRLITPSTDLQRWPMGYAVYRTGSFATSEELLSFMRECESDFMSPRLDDDVTPRLRSDLVLDDDGPSQKVHLRTLFSELTFEHEVDRALLKSLGQGRTIGRIVGDLMDRFDAAMLYHAIRRLHHLGLFDELPLGAAIPAARLVSRSPSLSQAQSG